MKYKSFSAQFWEQLSKALDQELKTNSKPVAAFDADGTLWDTDLGESFFKWQIENSHLPNLPANPWKYYCDWKNSGDPRPAYLWLAQINQDQKLTQVHEWAESALKSIDPVPIFPDQQKLIQWLLKNKVQVYIITASVKWAVEPGAKRLGLKYEDVLGVRTRVDDGVVTDHQEGLITYREGKPEALLQVTNGKKPFFACGNTMGDFALLESATRMQLAVGAAPKGHELFETEEKLRSEARSKNWLIHHF
jgi:HAD superfamily phosphoserine phosphatase-like hydrolase